MRQNSEKGLVFNIQRFSIHDGPGIRTTVFFKGCPLNCLWCSNPESQGFAPSLLVRDSNCVGCGKCVSVCRRLAISITEEKRRVIDWEKCDQCLECVKACVSGSLNHCGQLMTGEEIIQEVLRDSLFYKNSGGGVTLSGGEPLNQFKFVLKLLRALKERDLHVTLDTSGYAPGKVFEEVLNHIDLVLFDIKHLDDGKHRQYTGVSNKNILANARRAANKVRTWFRVPLIADFNDSPDHTARIAGFAKEIGIEKISLLPYHEGGMSKCLQIGRRYLMTGAKPPADEHVLELKKIISEQGVSVSIGS